MISGMTLAEHLQVDAAPLGAGGWVVPGSVEAADGVLSWEWTIRTGATTVEAPSDLVDRFVSLRGADDAAIVAFAAKWGSLFRRPDDRGHAGCRACEIANGHGLPYRFEMPPHGAEPLAAWRRLVGDVWGVLQVSAAYLNNEPVETTIWQSFQNIRAEPYGDTDGAIVVAGMPSRHEELFEPLPVIPPMRFLGPPAEVVGSFTDLLLEPVQIRTFMAPEGPSARLEPTGLLGALGLQLMTKITTAKDKLPGLAFCAGCGEFFTPSRKPSRPRSWCNKCRETGVRGRVVARDYRARNRG